MQQNEGGSYLEMEEIQKGERETRRKADKAGWQGVFLKQCSPFCHVTFPSLQLGMRPWAGAGVGEGSQHQGWKDRQGIS